MPDGLAKRVARPTFMLSLTTRDEEASMARKTPKPAGVNRNGIRIARGARHQPSAVCLRKDVYRSREQAESYAIFFRSSLGTRELLRSYRCPGCGGWHLTKRVGSAAA
jgi:hypothetical protein